jgi:hypothetical protein
MTWDFTLLGTSKMKALTSLGVEPRVQLHQFFIKEKTTDSVHFVVAGYVFHGRTAKLNVLSDARNGMASIERVDGQ